MRTAKRTFCILIILSICATLLVGCAFFSDDEYQDNLTSYALDIVLDDENKTIFIDETVDYVNNYDVELSDIAFHLYPQAYREGAIYSAVTESADISSAYENGISYGGIEISSVKVDGEDAEFYMGGTDNDMLVVTLGDILMPTHDVEIEIESTATIPNVRHRFGYSDNTINLGNFYPIASVFEGGKWDDSPYYSNGDPFYSEIADYEVSIIAPDSYTVAMSGDAVENEISDGYKKTSCTMLSARDTAIVLGKFETLTTKADDTTIKYYYYDDENAQESLQTAKDSIETYNTLFGEYPYSSYSVCQTAFLNGGMEYPGLVYISDRVSNSLYQEVIIHETAHQWWYGLVGNNQVENAWVDETLAEYSTTLFYEYNSSYGVSYSERIADALSTYSMYCDLFSDDETFSTSMNRRLDEFSSSLEYTYMTYVKGQVMMDSLRATLGQDTLLQCLNTYFNDYKFKISSQDLLIASFENASERQLVSFFDSWTSGKTQVS